MDMLAVKNVAHSSFHRTSDVYSTTISGKVRDA